MADFPPDTPPFDPYTQNQTDSFTADGAAETPDPDEHRAAMILAAIEAQNEKERALKYPTPDMREDVRALVEILREAIHITPESSEIKRLEQQAYILDLAFRRLISDADTTYENSDRLDCDPMKFAAAFKAQDQYRRTIKTLKLLKSRPKILKRRGKRSSKNS